MKIVRDIVVRASGDGWGYKLARLLIDVDGNAALFVLPGDEPKRLFTVDVKASARTLKGAGTDADGGKVVWSQRSAGCGYKLAKCQVSTAQLSARWQRWLDRQAAVDPGTSGDDEPSSEVVALPVSVDVADEGDATKES